MDRKPLTSADIKRMSPDEIVALWRNRQIEDRAAGRDHYTVLIDAATEEVVCAIG
jgi:hypothetical protein